MSNDQVTLVRKVHNEYLTVFFCHTHVYDLIYSANYAKVSFVLCFCRWSAATLRDKDEQMNEAHRV